MTNKPETPPPPSGPGPTHPPSKPGIDSPWMSVKETALYARRHPKTVLAALHRYERSKWRKGLRGAQANGPNSCWRIHRDDVDRWCAGEPPLQPSRRLRAAS